MVRKSFASIERCVLAVFSELGDMFSGPELCTKVRQKIGKNVMDGTVTRRLRYLRQKKKLSYKMKNASKSLYRKLPVV